MSVAATEAGLIAELWLSFASLVHAYTAAAGLNPGRAAKFSSDGNRLTAEAGAAILEVECDRQTGAGKWLLRGPKPQAGEFTLLAEGRIAVEGRTLDLDHAAIDFAAALIEGAAESAERES